MIPLINALPYERELEYFSPSSLAQFEADPVGFYLQRLGPPEFAPPREPQGFAAARGEAFDAAIKALIEDSEPDYSGVDPIPERDLAISEGARGAAYYVECGALEAARKDRPLKSVRSDIYGVAPGTDIPLRGKIDLVQCVRARSWRYMPLDWKTTGASSPNRGYAMHYGTTASGREVSSPHVDSRQPMESLNGRWADQLAIYHWLLGGGPHNAPVAVDQVCYLPNGALRVAQYRTLVSRRHQLALVNRLARAWHAVHERRVVPPELASGGIEMLLALPKTGGVW